MVLPFLLLLTASVDPPLSTAARIDPKHRLVEGVATDRRTIWVSSVLDRTIVACRTECRDWAILPEGLHPLGIAWDFRRKWLWVAADCPDLPGVSKCDRGALVALDKRGKVRRRIAPFVGEFHPGDVSADRGEVFLSDSRNGMVFRLTPNERGIMAVILPDVGKSAQGTALDASGKQLIVADYSQGIGVTGIATFKRTLLPREDGKPLRGIDGVVRCGGSYYAIYNGAPPGRLIRFTVSGDRIAFDTLIEGGVLTDPTQLATDGKRLLIVANAGWEAAAKSLPRKEPAPILAIPLPEHC
jgi:hypothetical protein